MSQYTKVQCISWELYTGPVTVHTHTPSRGWYTGLLSAPALPTSMPDTRIDVIGQCVDIDARVAFTADAIAKARALADPSPEVLKVFLAPEFLYRGAGGAYLYDLMSGWDGTAPAKLGIAPKVPYYSAWPGLIRSLKALAAQHGNEDWLFVFGSAISAAFPMRKAGAKAYYLDAAQARGISNMALIQRGGAAPTATPDQVKAAKYYLQPVDFFGEYAGFISQIGTQVKAGKPRSELRSEMLGTGEGSPVFRMAGIEGSSGLTLDCGIEIGFDHAVSGKAVDGGKLPTQNFGRLRNAGQRVRLQLVPSCGMNLIPESLWLQPAAEHAGNAYAFHCDGLSNVAGLQYGSHTQVWNRTHKLLEASDGVDQGKAVPRPALASSVSAVTGSVVVAGHTIEDRWLWSNGGTSAGAGSVRVVAPLPL